MAGSDAIVRRGAHVIGVFALMGVALGLTGMIGIDAAADVFIQDGDDPFGEAFVALVFLQSIFISWFLGPVVALVSGLYSARSLDRRSAGIAGASGSFVGFFIMVTLALILMGLGFPDSAGGGGDLGLGDHFGAIAFASLPTTLVGGLVGLLGTSLLEK